MGVTIHFSGKLKSPDDFIQAMAISEEFAEANTMPYQYFEEDDKLLLRVKNEEDWDYQGPVKGIRLQPHPNSDPLLLEFDENYIVQQYCKTQFAGASIHLKIIELLRKLESYFENLLVNDEGEYWETNDEAVLQEHLDIIFDKIEDAKKENPNLNGPFRVADGRIVDLMKQDNLS